MIIVGLVNVSLLTAAEDLAAEEGFRWRSLQTMQNASLLRKNIGIPQIHYDMSLIESTVSHNLISHQTANIGLVKFSVFYGRESQLPPFDHVTCWWRPWQEGSRPSLPSSPSVQTLKPPKRKVVAQEQPLPSPIVTAPRPSDNILAFISGAKDDSKWREQTISQCHPSLSINRMTGATLGYDGNLPRFTDHLQVFLCQQPPPSSVNHVIVTSMSHYHSEQWMCLALFNDNIRQSLVNQLISAVQAKAGRGPRPDVKALIMHVHSTNDVCSNCAQSLARLMQPNHPVITSLWTALTADGVPAPPRPSAKGSPTPLRAAAMDDRRPRFLIIASSRVDYMRRRNEAGHDQSYQQCLRDQLSTDRRPSLDQYISTYVRRLNPTTLNLDTLEDFIRNNLFLHFVVPNWPAPMDSKRLLGRNLGELPSLDLKLPNPKAKKKATAATIGSPSSDSDSEASVSESSSGYDSRTRRPGAGGAGGATAVPQSPPRPATAVLRSPSTPPRAKVRTGWRASSNRGRGTGGR